VVACSRLKVALRCSRATRRATAPARKLQGALVELPALAERIENLPGLLSRLMRKQSTSPLPRVDAHLVERLCLHAWPYNLREFERTIQCMLIEHGDRSVLQPSHLPAAFASSAPRCAELAASEVAPISPRAVRRTATERPWISLPKTASLRAARELMTR